jgi:hypothetical protein
VGAALCAFAHFTLASHIHLQRGNERLLRDVDLAELAHALLALLLLLQQLALARDVAAVAFRGDVLPEGTHGLAREPSGRGEWHRDLPSVFRIDKHQLAIIAGP